MAPPGRKSPVAVTTAQAGKRGSSLFAVAVLAAALCSCTITPRQVTSTEPGFSGNVANSGILGFSPDGSAIIDEHARSEYNALLARYADKLLVRTPQDAGLRAANTVAGTWLMDKEHLELYGVMKAWLRGGK